MQKITKQNVTGTSLTPPPPSHFKIMLNTLKYILYQIFNTYYSKFYSKYYYKQDNSIR